MKTSKQRFPRIHFKPSKRQMDELAAFWDKQGKWQGAMFAQPRFGMRDVAFAIVSPACAADIDAVLRRHYP